ncbi:MAG: hypothetical protein WBX15_05895 [Thermoanaerobaculia bacterium]
MDLDQATASDFREHVGSNFVIEVPSDRYELTLVEVIEQPQFRRSESTRSPFSLIFRGERERILAQGTYSLRHDKLGELPLFIVPVQPEPDGSRYEAVFN